MARAPNDTGLFIEDQGVGPEGPGVARDIGVSIGVEKRGVSIQTNVVGQNDDLVGIGSSDGSDGR
jgi:hypothetical protein